MIDRVITLVGLGGIGSWVVKKIARLGCSRLVLYDPDIVEFHNLQNQDYDWQDISRPKVQATMLKLCGLAQWHKDRGNSMKIIPIQEKADENSRLAGIVVVSVDDAEGRRKIFSACRYRPRIPLYIEAGAAENRGVVRVLNPCNKDQVAVYERLLETYAEEGPAACVTPSMSGQFESAIVHWISKFDNGWRPSTIMEVFIDYRNDPYVISEPIL